MKLHVRLSTTLRAFVPGYDPDRGLDTVLDEGGSVRDLALALALPLKEIRLIMVNGSHASLETVLRDRDRVAFFPAVGGG